MVLEPGDGVTQVVPIYEEQALPQGIDKSDFAAADLTESMRKLLNEKLQKLSSGTETETIRNIK